jgi:ketosteroid isomerase-like protein
MPPNAPANVGRQAIRSWAQSFFGAFRTQFALSVEEVQMTGDWAFERGAYRITLTSKAGGEPLQDIGKYITIYQRQPGGSWKVARDIWNSNTPPPRMQ